MGSISVHLANVSAYAEAIYALTQGHYTVRELAAETGLAYNTARKFLATLRRRGLVHVAAWECDTLGRYTVAAFAWGPGRDVRRPPRKTLQERKAKYYEKLQHLAIQRGTPVKLTRVKKYEVPAVQRTG